MLGNRDSEIAVKLNFNTYFQVIVNDQDYVPSVLGGERH